MAEARTRARVRSRSVDDGIPAPSGQLRKVAASIAMQQLDVATRFAMAPTVENRDRMPARESAIQKVPAKKGGSSEDEDIHRHCSSPRAPAPSRSD